MTLRVHDLTIGDTDPGAATVIAVHGITGNALNWVLLAEEFGKRFSDRPMRLIAPDLRGRCDSPVREDGALGLDVHVQDLLELAQSLPEPPLLVAHSMGAAVCALLGSRYPEAVRGLVLVDGGASFPAPVGMPASDIDALLRVVLGPAMRRLERTFDSPQPYVAYVEDHPAIGPLLTGPDGEYIRQYLLYDVREDPRDPGVWRSSCVLDAIRADGRDVLFHPGLPGAMRIAAVAGVPMELLWSPRGLFDEPQGLYDKDRLALLAIPSGVRVTKVPDTNHYSIVLSRNGIHYVLDAVERLLREPDDAA